MYAKVDQVVDPGPLLLNIDEAQCHDLDQSSCQYTFNYVHDILAVYFSAPVNPASVMYGTAVHVVTWKKDLNDDLCIVMLYGRHRHHSVVMIWDRNQRVRTIESLCRW